MRGAHGLALPWNHTADFVTTTPDSAVSLEAAKHLIVVVMKEIHHIKSLDDRIRRKGLLK